MRIGVIGPKHLNGVIFNDIIFISKHLDPFCKELTQVVSGGAKGVESLVETWALDHNYNFVKKKPNIKHANGDTAVAFIMRNIEIVNACDLFLYFWDGSSALAVPAIAQAVRTRKKTIIIPMTGLYV